MKQKTTSKPDHEDPRVGRTRELIFHALKSLSNEKDYESISVGEITARARINRATFYAHYKDKDDLFRKIIDTETSKLFEQQLSAYAKLDPESFAALIRTSTYFLERLRATPLKADDRYKHYVRCRLQAEINTTLRKWFDAYPDPRSDAQKELTSTVISGGILGGCSDWTCADSPLPLSELIEILWKIVEPYASQGSSAKTKHAINKKPRR